MICYLNAEKTLFVFAISQMHIAVRMHGYSHVKASNYGSQ